MITVPDGADPYPGFAALRTAAPVHRAVLPDGLAVWLVTRYADVRAGFADPRLGNDPTVAAAALGGQGWRPENLHNALRTDPPRHTRLRKLTAEAFTARRVAALRPRIATLADRLLDGLPRGVPVDLIGRYAFGLPIAVICRLLGVPEADRDRFRSWTQTVLAYATDPATAAAIEAARDGIRDYLTGLIARRRARPRDDLVSRLAAVRDADGEPLSELELLSTVSVLLTAGHETTVNLIGNGVLALLRTPGKWAELRTDPGRLPAAVDELLRYDTPIVPGVMKFARTDLVLGGQPVAAGDLVLLAVGAANRDPAGFTDPDSLRLDRRPNPHLSFGHGIHFCVGAALARAEAELALGALLRRYATARLAVPPEKLHWRGGFIRGLRELPVVLD